MPITPLAIPVMASALIATGNIGFNIPQLAAGVVNGVTKWVQVVNVIAPAVGTLGVGVGIAPLIVPAPTLFGPLTAGFVTFGVFGPLAPLLITGLANGLSQTFAMGQIFTVHPTVGVGGGVASFLPPPPLPFIIMGMDEAGMSGIGVVQMAGAIGQALMLVFSALTLPVSVVGTPSLIPGSGVGTGVIK